MFAASHPAAARALVMVSPLARLVRAPGYEWAPSREERDAMVERVVEHWGTELGGPAVGHVGRRRSQRSGSSSGATSACR